MFIGIYLIMVNDPQILFNDGFYPLLHVVMPEGCLLRPRFPSALGCRTHALARLFDVLGGALVQEGPRAEHGRRLRHEPVHALLGLGRRRASSSTRWRSSTAASPAGRSATGWTATRGGRCSRTSRPSTSRPTTRCGSTATRPSPTRAAPGFHRGGNGVEKRYVYLEPGEVSIHDDRWLTRPVGRARRLARRALGEAAPARRRHRGACCRRSATSVEVAARRHARLPHRRRRRLEGPARPARRGRRARRLLRARLRASSRRGLRRRRRRRRPTATEAERARQREERGDALAFDFGPPLEEMLARCEAETGLDAADAGDAARAGRRSSRARRRSPRSREDDGHPEPVGA